MTNDLPRPVEPSGTQDRPSARTRPRPASPVDPAAADGAGPAKKAAPAKKTQQREGLVLRSSRPPVDQLDFDDRHDTRATGSKKMMQRYATLHKERRRNDWHYLTMGLVMFVVGVAVYLASFALMLWLFPDLNPRLVAEIVGLAYIAGGSGVAARSAGRALKQRYDRGRGQASDST